MMRRIARSKKEERGHTAVIPLLPRLTSPTMTDIEILVVALELALIKDLNLDFERLLNGTAEG